MLSNNIKQILSENDPVFIIDSINELCEFPGHSWIKDVIDHAPLSIVSVEKQGRIIAELNRREKIAREKLLHIYKAV